MVNQIITAAVGVLTGGTIGVLGKALLDYLTGASTRRQARQVRQEDQDDMIRKELWDRQHLLETQVTALSGAATINAVDCEKRIGAVERRADKCEFDNLALKAQLLVVQAELKQTRDACDREHGALRPARPARPREPLSETVADVQETVEENNAILKGQEEQRE
jgi:hypothetical protein